MRDSKPKIIIIPFQTFKDMPLLTYALWWNIYNLKTVYPCASLLTYPLTSSVFYETLRMFPPVWLVEIHFNHSLLLDYNSCMTYYPQVVNIPKLSEEDTTLTVGNAAGEKLTIPVLKGVRIVVDAPGLHYNREENKIYWFRGVSTLDWIFYYINVARYWKDPHSFKPARFLEDWPKDAFMPFSAGECYWQGLSEVLLLF